MTSLLLNNFLSSINQGTLFQPHFNYFQDNKHEGNKQTEELDSRGKPEKMYDHLKKMYDHFIFFPAQKKSIWKGGNSCSNSSVGRFFLLVLLYTSSILCPK